jgi:hypothetical protein
MILIVVEKDMHRNNTGRSCTGMVLTTFDPHSALKLLIRVSLPFGVTYHEPNHTSTRRVEYFLLSSVGKQLFDFEFAFVGDGTDSRLVKYTQLKSATVRPTGT